MKLTPLEIEAHEFAPSWRGYQRDEVRAFLARLSIELTQLLREHAALQDQVRLLQERLSHTEGYEEQLREAMLAATQLRAQAQDEAQRSAQVIIREAELRAEELIAQGQRSLRSLESEALSLKAQRARAAAELRATLESHLKLIAYYEASLEEERAEAARSSTAARPQARERAEGALDDLFDHEALAQAQELTLTLGAQLNTSPSPQTSAPTQGAAPIRASAPTQGAAPTRASAPTQGSAPIRASAPTQGAAPTRASAPTQGAAPIRASAPTQGAPQRGAPAALAHPQAGREPTHPGPAQGGPSGVEMVQAVLSKIPQRPSQGELSLPPQGLPPEDDL